jgi:hypothetical protein
MLWWPGKLWLVGKFKLENNLQPGWRPIAPGPRGYFASSILAFCKLDCNLIKGDVN